ncbi:hypothetical protein HUJ05_000796 [Dendroctonus ponderosae]|nr:hypothetical protein HUJ05_000796 [Dendroctonus ponderosae]
MWKLTFTESPLEGKTMIVQNVNTGSDLGENQFDVQIPGGGVGIFTLGCSTQWNSSTTGWGAQYGGISSDDDCDELPTELQSGCHFRFGWYEDADNPTVDFEQRLFNSVGCRPIRLVIRNMMEGISTNAECSKIPEVLQAGCCFRFGWYENADNPQVNFEQLECREELTI